MAHGTSTYTNKRGERVTEDKTGGFIAEAAPRATPAPGRGMGDVQASDRRARTPRSTAPGPATMAGLIEAIFTRSPDALAKHLAPHAPGIAQRISGLAGQAGGGRAIARDMMTTLTPEQIMDMLSVFKAGGSEGSPAPAPAPPPAPALWPRAKNKAKRPSTFVEDLE